MDNTSKLPPEILLSIFLLSDNELKDLAPVSKHWNQTINKGLSTLFQQYTQNESLEPYIDLAQKKYTLQDPEKEVEVNVQRIKLVFNEVLLKAKKMGYKEEPLTIQNLSAAHLQEVAKWMEEQEASNLNTFASRIPEMKPFLESVEQLPSSEKAQAIRIWMEENQDVLESITQLNLMSSGLNALPKEIQYFTKLQHLNLQNNQIKVIPTEICRLHQLQKLNLFNNKIITLPSEIGSLTQLRELDLFNNKITTLPSEIGALTQLQELYLAFNQIETIPSEMKSLTQLRKLDFNNNKITIIPSEIGSLIQLQTLYLSNNQIKEIPSEIGTLIQLQVLYLSNNQIKEIPSEINSLIKLVNLNLKGNEIITLPSNIDPSIFLEGNPLNANQG